MPEPTIKNQRWIGKTLVVCMDQGVISLEDMKRHSRGGPMVTDTQIWMTAKEAEAFIRWLADQGRLTVKIERKGNA